ncbi:MAG: hypothetical protein IJN39_06960, partial [Clostridia bacterium]|nr:hypothetical protein [Clostridia bacterium]
GKISFAYMNKILTADEPPKPVKTAQNTVPQRKVRPTGFNNFESRTRDFDAIKKRAKEKLKNK